MKYTVDYFIKKFSKIPAKKWAIRSLDIDGKKCALGHCGVNPNTWKPTNESTALLKLFKAEGPGDWAKVYDVNDGNDVFPIDYRELGKTPKTRILNYLKGLKK